MEMVPSYVGDLLSSRRVMHSMLGSQGLGYSCYAAHGGTLSSWRRVYKNICSEEEIEIFN